MSERKTGHQTVPALNLFGFIIFENFAQFEYSFHLPQVKRRKTAQVKRHNLICGIRSFIYKLPHELLNNLRIYVLPNKEILGKSKNYVRTQPSGQSPLEKIFLALALKKYAKANIKDFLSCLIFLDFLFIILHRIVC